MRERLRLRFAVDFLLMWLLRFGEDVARLPRLENDIVAVLRGVITAQMRLRRAGMRS